MPDIWYATYMDQSKKTFLYEEFQYLKFNSDHTFWTHL